MMDTRYGPLGPLRAMVRRQRQSKVEGWMDRVHDGFSDRLEEIFSPNHTPRTYACARTQHNTTQHNTTHNFWQLNTPGASADGTPSGF